MRLRVQKVIAVDGSKGCPPTLRDFSQETSPTVRVDGICRRRGHMLRHKIPALACAHRNRPRVRPHAEPAEYGNCSFLHCMYIGSRDLSESKQAYLSEHVLLSEVWMWMTVVFSDGAFSFAVHMRWEATCDRMKHAWKQLDGPFALVRRQTRLCVCQ